MSLVLGLSQAGFTSREPLAVNGTSVAPRSVLLALLQKDAPKKPARDVEAIPVVITGKRGKKRSSAALEMWAEYSARPELSAVARDTGFPAAIAAVMRCRGEIPGVGVQAPEHIVPPSAFFSKLRQRGFRFRRWNFRT